MSKSHKQTTPVVQNYTDFRNWQAFSQKKILAEVGFLQCVDNDNVVPSGWEWGFFLAACLREGCQWLGSGLRALLTLFVLPNRPQPSPSPHAAFLPPLWGGIFSKWYVFVRLWYNRDGCLLDFFEPRARQSRATVGNRLRRSRWRNNETANYYALGEVCDASGVTTLFL